MKRSMPLLAAGVLRSATATFVPAAEALENGVARTPPMGERALGDHLHGKVLKFGIYEVPVDKTCARRISVRIRGYR